MENQEYQTNKESGNESAPQLELVAEQPEVTSNNKKTVFAAALLSLFVAGIALGFYVYHQVANPADECDPGSCVEPIEEIGITVDLFNAIPSPHLTKEIECNSLFERIGKLIETGDAYVVLPGGTGTLLEFAVIWEYFNKGLCVRKPFVSLGNIWNNIALNIDERMKFEKRETGMLKSFLEVEKCAEYIIKQLK